MRSIISTIVKVAVFISVISAIVFGIVLSLQEQEAESKETLERYGLAEGTPYTAKIIGIRPMQTGISGDFFLGSGDVSGLDSVLVIVFSVSIGDADYIMNVALNDVTFKQEADTGQSTVVFDLGGSPFAQSRDSLDEVLKQNFEGLEITLSPEEFSRITDEMP